ncbi:OmpA family protein [Pelobium sp.]|nr:OmpA family protein [Pelobium sp.]MDA9555719.1 OmpA family protein [Pelobium sp.]
MRKNITTIYLVFLLMMLVHQAKAQESSVDKKLSVAVSSFNNLRFAQAIAELKPIVAKYPENVDAVELLANSYRLTKQYKEALTWYEKLSKQSFIKPDWALRYAEALANNKEYEKSEQWYRKYLSMVPSDKRAALFSDADFEKLGKGVDWDIKSLSINTQASEYSPMVYKEGLIFTSNRKDIKPIKYVFAWNNTPFSDLYYVKQLKDIKFTDVNAVDSSSQKVVSKQKNAKVNDDNTSVTSNDSKTLGIYDSKVYTSISESDKLNHIEKLKGKINTKYHEGSSALLPDGAIMFTRNNYYQSKSGKSSDGVTKLKIFTASGFDFRTITPFNYNNDEYSVGHPTVSKDGKILIFSSDMPGGIGGVDLYFCIRLTDKSEWSRPVNFGRRINTEGDEEFPYLDNFNRLYFASNGWPGLGGLDVFSIELDDLKPVGTPLNLGPPLNSPFDDFAVAKSGDNEGYFSSNRRGNDDIFSFKKNQYKIILKGQVVDAFTNSPLSDAIVNLRNGAQSEQLKLNSNGDFEKEITSNSGYELNGTLANYLPDRRYVGTDGITKDTTIYVTLSLKKASKIQQYVISHCDSLKRVFNAENIYYDLDKYSIRPDAESSLNNLAALMKQYPDLKVITRSHCDSRASESYNRTLSLNRGESAKAYLVNKGIAAKRVSVEYYGKSKLVNNCLDGVACSEEEQQKNRRTEFEIIYNGINLSTIDCK